MLPYGQMSLWGIKMPQIYNLNLTFKAIIFIKIDNLKKTIKNKIRGIYRVGPHNKDVLSIIYGSLLGDAHAEKRLSGLGTRISFFQEGSHKAYMLYLHKLISELGYCNEKLPIIKEKLDKGKVRKVMRFHTWTYTSFNEIHEKWYVDGKKRVPCDIDKYLTPLALSIWISDDGAKVSKGIKLCTNSFTYSECMNLVDVLYKNFNLKVSVQSAGAKDQYLLYIWKESKKDLYKIVSPYIIPEMKYKII